MPVTAAGIHHDDAGPASDPAPLVFLHGATLDRRMWTAQVQELSARHRCLAVDRRGHGLSAPLHEGWDPVDDLVGVLDAAGVERCHLVGMSLGGCDAVAAAARHSERLRSLVLVAAWIPVEAMREWSPRHAETATTVGVDAARRDWLADPLFAAVRGRPDINRHLEAIVGENDLSLWTGPQARGLGGRVVAAAPTIQTPTLVVVGGLDLPAFRATARWLAETIPGAAGRPVTTVPGAGHMLAMEEPAALTAVLRDWVETL